jgi:Reverse transcriptase (RNA-dependent DNA polymerase).
MSSLYKLFSKVLTRRLIKNLDEQQPCEQAGFRTGLSIADHIQTINQVIEKVQEFNLPLYMAFVDYSKAFDSVEHYKSFMLCKTKVWKSSTSGSWRFVYAEHRKSED